MFCQALTNQVKLKIWICGCWHKIPFSITEQAIKKWLGGRVSSSPCLLSPICPPPATPGLSQVSNFAFSLFLTRHEGLIFDDDKKKLSWQYSSLGVTWHPLGWRSCSQGSTITDSSASIIELRSEWLYGWNKYQYLAIHNCSGREVQKNHPPPIGFSRLSFFSFHCL